MLTLYGISNCDTVRKARKWLEANEISFQFHDLRKDGISQMLIDNWLLTVSWEILLNKRGTTWRKLPDDVKQNISQAKAIQLMLDQPSIIKRPVLSNGNTVLVGFSESDYLEFIRQ